MEWKHFTPKKKLKSKDQKVHKSLIIDIQSRAKDHLQIQEQPQEMEIERPAADARPNKNALFHANMIHAVIAYHIALQRKSY